MRKLALLGAIGGLWLFLAAIPVFADGGPHQMLTNNGTAGLTADSCAGCHRAHTATAGSLLNSDLPALCLKCHDGTNATTDVLDGVQFSATQRAAPILGALRGGGFQLALMDSSNAARLSYTSSHGVGNIGHVSPLAINYTAGTTAAQPVTSTHGGTGLSGILSGNWGNGTVWGNGAINSGAGATVSLDCASCHNPHGNGQYRSLQTTPSLTATAGTYTVSIAAGVQVADTTTTGTHNYTIRPASDGWNANGSAINIKPGTNGDYWRYHWDPTGNLLWTDSVNLTTGDPMEVGWSGASATSVAGNFPVMTTTLNMTAPSATTTTFTVAAASGFPTPNFVIVVDSEKMLVTGVTGASWKVSRGILGTTAAAHTGTATVTTEAYGTDQNVTGLMTAWCIQCHTRYNGYKTAGGVLSPSTATTGTSASSLTANSADTLFMFKHGTTSIGCEQCHVSHGSNALMTGTNSLNFTVPGSLTVPPKVNGAGPGLNQTSGDSRLLKVDNRGTCQLCHDPTSTVTAGTYVGPTPTPGN